MPLRPGVRTWRRFGPPERHRIEAEVAARGTAHCPRCGNPLVARARSRLGMRLPTGARGQDLDCRGCRRFHARVLHTPGSLYLLRLRRLAAAVLRA